MPSSTPSTHLDRAAILLSAVCLLHCLAIPVALLVGTAASHWLIDTETEVHWILLALAAPLSGVTLWRGYSRHGSAAVLWLGGLGLLLMFLGVSHFLTAALELALTVAGVGLVLIAHVRNLMLNHRHA